MPNTKQTTNVKPRKRKLTLNTIIEKYTSSNITDAEEIEVEPEQVTSLLAAQPELEPPPYELTGLQRFKTTLFGFASATEELASVCARDNLEVKKRVHASKIRTTDKVIHAQEEIRSTEIAYKTQLEKLRLKEEHEKQKERLLFRMEQERTQARFAEKAEALKKVREPIYEIGQQLIDLGFDPAQAHHISETFLQQSVERIFKADKKSRNRG